MEDFLLRLSARAGAFAFLDPPSKHYADPPNQENKAPNKQGKVDSAGSCCWYVTFIRFLLLLLRLLLSWFFCQGRFYGAR